VFGLAPLRRTFDAALRDLSSPRSAVRASAVHDLGLVGDDDPRRAAEAIAPLVDDPAAEVRGAALTALGVLRARQHVERIAARVTDDDSTVRQLATVALAEVGGERALAALRVAADSPLPDVRYQGLLGVLALAPREGFELALAALDRDDPWIAAEAAEQLGRVGAEGPEDALDEGARGRAGAALARRVEGPDARVALAAAMALLRLGDEPRGARRVTEYVRTVGTVAGQALGDLGLDAIELLGGLRGEARGAACEALARVAWRVVPTPERAAARASLARLGDERASAEIVGQLRSMLPGRRADAVRLVMRARLAAAEGALLDLLAREGAEASLVLDALALVGGAPSLPVLARLARSAGDGDLREAARRALAAVEERVT
jgi:HEAT repeat protein